LKVPEYSCLAVHEENQELLKSGKVLRQKSKTAKDFPIVLHEAENHSF